MSLVISFVTRGRPERSVDTLTRTLPLMTDKDTKLVIAIDDDDQATIDILPKLPKDSRIIPDIRAREDALGAKWNRCLDYEGTCFLAMADYTPYLTPSFDEKILEAAQIFPDGIGVVYTHMANFSFPSSMGVTRKFCDLLGYMAPPYFPYWFWDHWVDDIAGMIDRIVHADIQVVVPKPEEKPPTQEMREPFWWATFYDSQRLFRRRQAMAIIDSPDFHEPSWRREMLKRNFPLHEFRSQWINDQVRGWMRNDPDVPPTERYQRIRALAAKMMTDEAVALLAELGEAA